MEEALRLLGNASAQLSTARRKRVLKTLNPEIQDLAGEQGHFKEAAPLLFGQGFEKTMKERAESLRILQKATKPPPHQQKFFQRGHSTAPPKEAAAMLKAPAMAEAGEASCLQVTASRQLNGTQPDRDLVLLLSVIKKLLVKRGIRSLELTKTGIIAGRLALFRDDWLKVTRDQWVLNTVMGYKIEFLNPPTQTLLAGAEPHRGGDKQNDIQRGHNKTAPRGSDQKVLLEPVPSPQHKLPRTASGNTNIPEESGKQTRPVVARQPNSCGVYKQPGRDSLRPGHEISQRVVDVVPRASHSSDGTTLTWERQCQGRHGVETGEGSLRLDVESKNF